MTRQSHCVAKLQRNSLFRGLARTFTASGIDTALFLCHCWRQGDRPETHAGSPDTTDATPSGKVEAGEYKLSFD